MNPNIEIITQETYVDKSQWDKGPWNDEPDKLHFVDKTTNMDCLVVRGPSGALCGYVGIQSIHPAYKADYNRVQVDVHGGLTYGSLCDEGGHICHVPRPGQPHDVFWLGFDCAHSGDLCPSYSQNRFDWGGYYKSLSYVIHETISLATQLAKNQPLREPYDWELED